AAANREEVVRGLERPVRTDVDAELAILKRRRVAIQVAGNVRTDLGTETRDVCLPAVVDGTRAQVELERAAVDTDRRHATRVRRRTLRRRRLGLLASTPSIRRAGGGVWRWR